MPFRSTLPLRGATDHPTRVTRHRVISIHAPLAGSDINTGHDYQSSLISIHAPLAGSDLRDFQRVVVGVISIHAPLAGSDLIPTDTIILDCGFRSTLPLRGATRLAEHRMRKAERFRSTLPLRGATLGRRVVQIIVVISIHAPLAGSDNAVVGKKLPPPRISIHAPLAGSDKRFTTPQPPPSISIHAPLAGSDHPTWRRPQPDPHFDPRSPCGERRC